MPLAKRRSKQEKFSQQTIHAKSKDQPFESERTRFYVRLTTAALQCTVRPIIFFFLTKSQPFNKKTTNRKINHIKQSEKTIQNLSIKTTQKTNTTYNRIIHQDFLNIIISPTATTSEPTTNTLLIKTQYNRKIQNNILHFEAIIQQTRKSKTLYFWYYETRKKIYLILSKFKTQGTNNNFNNNVLSAQKTKLLHCNQILTILTFIPDKCQQ